MVGLDVAVKQTYQGQDEPIEEEQAVYLSGNGPLVRNDLKNHSDNNDDISLEKTSIEEILEFGKPLFQSKFRNCMMHYDLAGYDVLSREHIKCPFYGIVETCFEGKNYHSYLAELRSLSDMIIDYLENRFDFSKIILQEL